MSKHSPLPWRVLRRNDGADIVTDDFPRGQARLICAVYGGGGDEEEAIANAEFIYRAMNAHDALLAACKTLLAICRWKCSPLDDVVLTDGRTNEQAMIEAMEVIQRVDGEPCPTGPQTGG